jgi:hypothetical protein
MRDILPPILVPTSNEEEFIGTVLDRVLAPAWPLRRYATSRELTVVDDA